MKMERPSALLTESDGYALLTEGQGVPAGRSPREPARLPETLSEARPCSEPFSRGSQSQVTLFLTVDTEDTYFDRPVLMTGDGIGREFGAYGIADELDERGLKATFFVNVYEMLKQPAGVVERLVKDLESRGHEVGLHSHPSPSHPLYRRPLFRLDRTEQLGVLRWGCDHLSNWTGRPVSSFRAGAYAANEDTLSALSEAGVAIDTSCFYPSPNNHFSRKGVNSVTRYGEIVEVPVTTVLRNDAEGALSQRKLDIDWLSNAQLEEALASLHRHGSRVAMFMMHSFSFIAKRTRAPGDGSGPAARFVSEPHLGRYVEVYGPKPETKGRFATFLDTLVGRPDVRVALLRDESRMLSDLASTGPDVIPVVRG